MAGDLVAERSAAVYASVASLVGASADEIALVENATRAWDMVAYSLGASFAPGDRVLTSQAEYASNVIGLLQLAARTGATVEVVPDDESGQLSVDALARDARRPGEARGDVVDPHAGRAGEPGRGGGRGDARRGRALPARRLPGRRAAADRRRRARVRLPLRDRAQVPAGPAGHRVPLRAPGVDRAARPAVPRRARGAVGARRSGRAARRRPPVRELGARSVANQLGLGAAVDYALALGRRRDRGAGRRARGLAARATRVGARPRRSTTAASSSAASSPSPSTASTCTSSPRACATQRINISVSTIDFARYDFEARDLTAVNRASVHYYNTEEELTRLVDAIATAPRG